MHSTNQSKNQAAGCRNEVLLKQKPKREEKWYGLDSGILRFLDSVSLSLSFCEDTWRGMRKGQQGWFGLGFRNDWSIFIINI